MIKSIKRYFNQFLNKSRKINEQPLNFGSLLVVILIDLFILFNVFAGLDDISQRYISPEQSYPCYRQWQSYFNQSSPDKNYEMIRDTVYSNYKTRSIHNYHTNSTSSIGQQSQICSIYAQLHDQVLNSNAQNSINKINKIEQDIKELEKSNYIIRSEYSSSLLEKIAGQKQEDSINQVSAAQAKQQSIKNENQIAQFNQQIKHIKEDLLSRPENTNFLNFLNQKNTFIALEQDYEKSSFWYPSIQLLLQALFLLPLIFIAFWVNNFAQAKGYGLVSLISWHLLIIFLIPLLVKIFQFLQIGLIFRLIFDFVQKILGGLLFLVNYFYILLIPLVGYLIIKFSQRITRKPKSLNQGAINFQNGLCIDCSKKIRQQDSYCPHCGFYQYCQCSNCHSLTYKHLPYCKECGFLNDSNSFR